ncbi:glutathione S-transferase [Sphingopyxis panaciterrae]|uniref:glutathione S-transferase family protein n=1 Tax=Sphingopyxis panaciterrae TaxID=363841 RepID=UPI0014243C45|nr:glutathione S-transferase N-terminal domain-containing protein [Sphingopyxis panaciterrae]NIJ38642.1 glutathione S-transferase [Sphingopyxis panaciterrae]
MIQLYGSPLSGNTHKVRMALAFLGLPWDERLTDAAARQSDAFAALTPMRQIPLFIDGDVILRDSQAILACLAARHRPGDWDGHTPEERGAIHVWLSHAANEIANGPATLRLARKFDAVIVEDHAQAVTARILPVVEARIEDHDWLAGGRMTIADLAASPYLALMGDAGIDVAAWPAIHAWTRRIAALPGFPAMPGWPAAPTTTEGAA